MNEPPTTWLVRCEGGALYEEFIDKGLVALGSDPPQPDLSGCGDREELRRTLASAMGTVKGNLSYATGVLTKFAIEMKKGDRILTYDPSARVYRVGVVTSGYQYRTDVFPGKQHFRSIRWDETILRDDLSLRSRRTLGSMISVFLLNDDVAVEIDAILRREPVMVEANGDEDDEDSVRDDVATRAREMVKDRVADLDWADMQELIAGVLRAMGYKTRVSPRGPDRGRDIVASPDGLGLEQPRIVVEVKHRQGQIGAPAIRSFLGGLQPSERGLFVSTGGFTREARYEADRASTPTTLLDIDEVVGLLLEHYNRADGRLRTLIPLVPVLWPAS